MIENDVKITLIVCGALVLCVLFVCIAWTQTKTSSILCTVHIEQQVGDVEYKESKPYTIDCTRE